MCPNKEHKLWASFSIQKCSDAADKKIHRHTGLHPLTTAAQWIGTYWIPGKCTMLNLAGRHISWCLHSPSLHVGPSALFLTLVWVTFWVQTGLLQASGWMCVQCSATMVMCWKCVSYLTAVERDNGAKKLLLHQNEVWEVEIYLIRTFTFHTSGELNWQGRREIWWLKRARTVWTSVKRLLVFFKQRL